MKGDLELNAFLITGQQCLVSAQFGVQRCPQFFAQTGQLLLGETGVGVSAFEGHVSDFNGFLQRYFPREKIFQIIAQLGYPQRPVLLKGGDALGRHTALQA